MLKAFEFLDHKITKKAQLLLGGGGALVLAHHIPLSTLDLDALFYKSGITVADLIKEIQEIALDLNIPKDWINPHFDSFLYTLPKDYNTRLKTVFTGKRLTVNALGAEDLLVLKCFAGRDKDKPHARALLKRGLNVELVQNHIRSLIDAKIPKAQQAYDMLDELLDEGYGQT